jgi:hypothetical protein
VKLNSKVKILDTKFPPDYPPELVEQLKQRVYTVKKIDGMYSLCVDNRGEIHHPIVWSEVEVVEEGEGSLPFD